MFSSFALAGDVDKKFFIFLAKKQNKIPNYHFVRIEVYRLI